MREAAFVKTNLNRWEEFDRLVSNPRTDPDRLSELFIQLTDDLAYANTHYPESKTVQYLNGLASKVHQGIYRNKKEDRGRIVRFWKYELPEVAYRGRRYLLLSFVIFIVAALIGTLSLQNDENFARLILGDFYVNMTIENIQDGDPMGVYKDSSPISMWVGIAVNNIRVSVAAFALGIFFSLGTFYILFRNGIMVGVFQYFFFQYNLGYYSFLTIWIHGTIEISAIIIAGAAGLMMGNRLLFPGTYSRLVAFRQGAKDGLKVIIGLVPLFIIAAWLESYITRLTELPDAIQLGIIVLSFVFIVWYFILYPYQLYHHGSSED
ncbi:MAG TPA: hypothetical protein DCE41_35000 [Cytophagales bacterium]|nr:hypothetical protein [Cytophagales bacterium]HAA24185.1 hypothetical protein [Cytophagales bacterium]HAP60966.1 hypothetical protein [Cytophagales bacterium]